MAENKVRFLRGTATEYAGAVKDEDTFYYTTNDGKLYIGNKEVSGSGSITIDDTLSDTSKNPVQNKVINAALKGGNEITGSSSYNLSDTVEYPLIGFVLHGKSIQNSVPTPTNPIDIVSVGDKGFDIVSKDDTHFNLLSVRNTGNGIISKQPCSIAKTRGEKSKISIGTKGAGLTYQWQYLSSTVTDWTNSNSSGNKTDTLIPEISDLWNNVKIRCIVTDSSGNIEISNESTIYVVSNDCEVKTASIVLDDSSFFGIPVSDGGNYTDSTGQQWICDELIFDANGTGKIIKRTGKYTFTGNESFALRGNSSAYIYSVYDVIKYKHYSGARIISNKYSCVGISDRSDTAISNLKVGETSLFYNTGYLNDHIIYFGSSCTTLADFKSEIVGSTIIYPLAEQQEIELTAAEVAALKVLQTFDGTTSISNSANAEMSVKYCTNKVLSEYVLPIVDSKADSSHVHNIATTESNGFMSAVDKKALEILKSPSATCTTARSDLNKVVALDNFLLTTGAIVVIKFTDTGTANPTSGNFTLNVNGTGAKNMYYASNGSAYGITYRLGWMFSGNRIYTFRYNGTAWFCLDYNVNTWRGIQNNLTSDSTTDSLSAAQGKALKTLVDSKADAIHKQAYTASECVNFTADDNTLGVTPAAVKKAISTFEPKSHTHDDRYYTESEIDTKLNAKLNTSLKGAANGLAELDASGKVPSSQLPSYVDDVLEYAKLSSFPATGESGKIYIAQDTNKTYRWSGSAYVEISPSLALGETSATAYRGDRGKIAYDHSQSAHAPSNAQANVIETVKVNGVTVIPNSKAVDITLNNIGGAAKSHTHDDRYYTESEMNTKLNAKAECIKLSGNVDLNTVTTPGFYNYSEPSATITNGPSIDGWTPNYFGLEVIHTAAGGYYVQIMYVNRKSYRRSCAKNSSDVLEWSSWTEELLTDTTYKAATSSTLGLVKSGTDITVDSNGNVSVKDDSHNHIISNVDGLQTALNGKASTAVATTSANGLMSSSSLSKLNGIESGAIRVHKALTSNGTTATTTKGYTYGVAGVTTSPYNYAKWYAYLDSGVTTLTNGMIISIKIPVAGCNYGCCISIDGGTTFKPVVYNTGSSITTNFGNGVELLLMYDSNGTGSVWSNSSSVTSVTGVWRVMNSYDSGNTISSAMCYTSAGTAAKTATFHNYALLAKSYLLVNIVYSNTAKSALTMNINNRGAKPIHINGAASSSSNYTLPAGTYIAYYDGTNYYFRTDGKIPANISGDAATVNGLTVQTAVPANAKFTDTVYTHPTTSGNKHIPSGGSSGQILRWSADGTAVWGNDNNTTYSNFVKSGSGAKAGLVPAPPTTAGTTKYLREDGTWVVPPNTWRGVVDNLTSTDTTKSLSANQGKVLKGLVDGKAASSHTHNVMTGATADAAGTSGFVPAPVAGDQDKFLKANGTWSSPPSIGSSVNRIVNGTGSSFTYEGDYKLFFYNIKGISNNRSGTTNSTFVYESKNGWLYLPDSSSTVFIKLAYYTYQSGPSSSSTINYYLRISNGSIKIVDNNQDYLAHPVSATLEVCAV